MIAYFDCFSGISGDMTLGALMDLGLSVDVLNDMIQQLHIENTTVEKKVQSYMGIQCTQAIVNTQASPMRHYADICKMIQDSALSENAKNKSLGMFQRLAEVESKIHGCDITNVHFHEVGAVDSIVDIVGTACGLESLGINHIIFSPLPMGTGFVQCQHGRLPIPAPATLNILTDVPVYGTQIQSELVTPTGALFAACLAESYGSIPGMQIKRTGYGAGSRVLDTQPNLLRIISGEDISFKSNDNTMCESIGVIETQIDDMAPESLSYAMSLLMSSGALDVLFLPAYMKKNRLATQVQVICKPDDIQRLTNMLLQETSTIGVRYHVVQRKILIRERKTIQTPLGKIQAKKIIRPDGSEMLTPEFESCRQLAEKNNMSLQSVYDVFFRKIFSLPTSF
jgi:hypothetical protein